MGLEPNQVTENSTFVEATSMSSTFELHIQDQSQFDQRGDANNSFPQTIADPAASLNTEHAPTSPYLPTTQTYVDLPTET